MHGSVSGEGYEIEVKYQSSPTPLPASAGSRHLVSTLISMMVAFETILVLPSEHLLVFVIDTLLTDNVQL